MQQFSCTPPRNKWNRAPGTPTVKQEPRTDFIVVPMAVGLWGRPAANWGGDIGILSERDVVRALAERGAGVLTDPVARVMTRTMATCTESKSVDSIMEQMTAGKVRHVPVVEHEQLVGFVSIGDVVTCFQQYLQVSKQTISRAQAEERMFAKLEAPAFLADVRPLLSAEDARKFDDKAAREAFRLVFSTFINRIRGNAWKKTKNSPSSMGCPISREIDVAQL